MSKSNIHFHANTGQCNDFESSRSAKYRQAIQKHS